MSRIGKLPVLIPSGVTIKEQNGVVSVTGAKGVISLNWPKMLQLKIEEGKAMVLCESSAKGASAMWGTYRSLLNNAVLGVNSLYKKNLELVGVGFRAIKTGNNLTLSVGFSHQVIITPPEGITLEAADTKISVIGVDKCLVGQVAANIRKVRKPEPYKGKGIRYEGEIVKRKAGKAGKVGA